MSAGGVVALAISSFSSTVGRMLCCRNMACQYHGSMQLQMLHGPICRQDMPTPADLRSYAPELSAIPRLRS